MTTYYAFSDESNYNNGKHKSIAMILVNEAVLLEIEKCLNKILIRYQLKIKKFKWKEIKTKNTFNALKEFLIFLFKYIEKEQVFITTLKWSVNDERHNITSRDDLSNLQYMYYKLIVDLINRKTKNVDEVIIFPDHNEVIDWNNLENILLNSPILSSKRIHLNPSTTEEKNLIQIADIFAGIARSSFEDWEDFNLMGDPEQTRLVKIDKSPTGRQQHRFKIYRLIYRWAKKNKLRISLNGTKGFLSHDPDSPLNFWVYKPQHEKDKAPIKK